MGIQDRDYMREKRLRWDERSQEADETPVVVKVGAAGGSVTLVGRKTGAGTWQLARISNDQTEALLGETGDGVVRSPSIENLEWVGSWEEGLRLMDQYPWARLHPMVVHAEFVERVRVAVEERLAVLARESDTERVREKWERLLRRVEPKGPEGCV